MIVMYAIGPFSLRVIMLRWPRPSDMLPMGSWYAIPNHRTGLTVFTGPFTSIALVLLLLISVALTTFPLISAQADDCLAAPNAPAPHGTYWYYHLNRATQQKCWYVRTFDTHAQHATAQASSSNGAPLSIRGSQSAQMTPPAIEQPSRAKTFPIKPAREPSLNAVQNEEVYQRAGVTTGTTPEAASQESKSFETSVQAAAARPTVWPDAAIKVQEASAAPADVRVNLVSDEGAARSGEQANNSGVPIIVFPVLALGLVVVGFGSRAVLRNAAAAYRVRITESAETDTTPPQNRGKRRPIDIKVVSSRKPRHSDRLYQR